MARLRRLPLGALLVLAPLLAPQGVMARSAQPQASRSAAASQAGEPVLRVLVVQGQEARLRPALSAAGLRLRDAQGRVLEEFGGQVVVQASADGTWLRLERADGADNEQWQLREVWLEALAGAEEADPGVWVGQRRYRGRLQLMPQGGQLQVVNHVPLETYLPSVVGSEMPASWPQEALQAQAVAARTYALKARKPSAAFDVQATTASQVYKGVEAETPSTHAAVQATRGLVLTYNNALIDAVFHSSSGGSTESSGDLWPRQLPYLVSVPDFDQASPVRDWRLPLDRSRLQRAFPELGGALGIDVVSTTPTGRVRQARVVGPSGQLSLTGAQLRSRLGLKSTWVRFELVPTADATAPVPAAGAVPLLSGSQSDAATAVVPVLPPPPLPAFSLPVPSTKTPEVVQLVAVGRGFGHGVGMSQWGALAMAQRGESFSSILKHYYRGTALQPYSELARTTAAGRGWTNDSPRSLAVSP
jgi:stage II sporulation protein D